ncbi:MAG: hypothetical protein JW876_07105 [Candidatus Krumholzibacteriota bacterium]|nr:hypothetical protein [Candidatus Krumholzibacteriota bacterium]
MNDTTTTKVPAIESRAGSCDGNGRESVKRSFLELRLATVIATILTAPISRAGQFSDRGGFFGFHWKMFTLACWLLIAGPAAWGSMHVHLIATRGKQPRIPDMLAVAGRGEVAR